MSRKDNTELHTAEDVRAAVLKLVRHGLSYQNICKALTMRCNHIYGGDLETYQADILDFCESYSSFSQIQNLIDKKILRLDGKSYVYDPITREKKPIVLQDYKDVVTMDFLQERYLVCSPTYEPRNSQDIIKRNNEVFFNIYMPPAWYAPFFYDQGLKVPDRKLPVEYANFFDHLFDGSEASIEHNLRWLANSLKSKNLTYNTLIGAEGAGKGVHDLILTQLHGPTNASKIRGEQFINSRFNADMKNKTYYYIDEAALMTSAAEDRFKDLVNDKIIIEEKGVDAVSCDNYMNVVISSNNYSSIKLKEGQRRFSVLEMADKNLRTNSNFNSDEKIKQLFQDEELIRDLGYYLFNLKYDEAKLAMPFLGVKNHKRVLDSALMDWENHLLTRMCRQFAGKTLFTRHLSILIGHELDNNKIRPSQSKLEDLSNRYRGFFKTARYSKAHDIFIPELFGTEKKAEDNQYSQIVSFSELADMPFDKYFLTD